jgi:hypothetical protein
MQILTNNSPKSANYIQSKFGITPLEFKEIIIFNCSMGWYINQALSLRPKTDSEDARRANAEIVSALSTIGNYRVIHKKNGEEKYLSYANVITNVIKYTNKEKMKKRILFKKNEANEYAYLKKWLLKEADRFENIKGKFNDIRKSSKFSETITGIKDDKFNYFIEKTLDIAGKNIEEMKYEKFNLKLFIYDFAALTGIPSFSHLILPNTLDLLGYQISDKLNYIIALFIFFVILIYIYAIERNKKTY